jgi:hypothetical protein
MTTITVYDVTDVQFLTEAGFPQEGGQLILTITGTHEYVYLHLKTWSPEVFDHFRDIERVIKAGVEPPEEPWELPKPSEPDDPDGF